jgi:hypothetical protein
MRLRYSIRWLLVFVTLAAIAITVAVRPTTLAHKFAARVNRGSFSEVDALGLRTHIWLYKNQQGAAYPYEELRIEAVVKPLSWRDIRSFRRRVSIGVWPPPNADHLIGMIGVYAFVRLSGPKLGGEDWE